jgi:hypothetical protein
MNAYAFAIAILTFTNPSGVTAKKFSYFEGYADKSKPLLKGSVISKQDNCIHNRSDPN